LAEKQIAITFFGTGAVVKKVTSITSGLQHSLHT